MPNAISTVFAVLLLIAAMVYVPVYQSFQKQDDLTQQLVYQTTTHFVDNVRTKGFITPKMMNDFQQELHTGTGYLYEVEMKHEKKIYTPVYSNPADPNTWEGNYVVDYDEYYDKQIMEYLFDQSKPTPINKRVYKMSAGDFFSVGIENKTKTKTAMMFDFLTGGLGSNDPTIIVPYGGMVLNEDY